MDLLRRLGRQLHHQRTARGVALLPFEGKQVHARKPYRQHSNVDEQRDRQRHPDGGNGDTPMVAARCVEPVAHRFAKSACHADRLNRVESRAGVGLRPAGGHIGEGLLATLNIHLRPALGWLATSRRGSQISDARSITPEASSGSAPSLRASVGPHGVREAPANSSTCAVRCRLAGLRADRSVEPATPASARVRSSGAGKNAIPPAPGSALPNPDKFIWPKDLLSFSGRAQRLQYG